MSKENFDKKLIELLESNPDFVDEAGSLHRANVRERAWKLDHDCSAYAYLDHNFAKLR